MTDQEEMQERLKQLIEGHITGGTGTPFAKVDPVELWHEEIEEHSEQKGVAHSKDRRESLVSADMQPGHPIELLREEHKIILESLEELSGLVDHLEADQAASLEMQVLSGMRRIADLILNADNHHRREEEALFPVMQEDGLVGPTLLMQVEHEALRVKVKRLVELLAQPKGELRQELLQELVVVGRYVADVLKEHIAKEETLVYPAAIYGLRPECWLRVLEKSEAIGYCRFASLRVAQDSSPLEL